MPYQVQVHRRGAKLPKRPKRPKRPARRKK